MKIGDATPAPAATPPTTVSIRTKSEAHGTKSNPTSSTVRAGVMNRLVASGLIQGENTAACAANMTRLHSVNIRAI